MSSGVWVRGKCAECGKFGNFELPAHIADAWVQHAELQRALVRRVDAGAAVMAEMSEAGRRGVLSTNEQMPSWKEYQESQCAIQIILDNIGA